MRRLALVVAAALTAPLTLLAEPAKACSCAPPDVDRELRDGKALAVVTRTDTDGGRANFRVEQAVGAALPATFTGEADNGGTCYPSAYHQYVTSMVVRREDGRWTSQGCGETDLGQTLHQLRGRPPTTSTARPVAVFAGTFGESRLAAVDERGEVAAWDGHPGYIADLAVCPGGRNVVAYASAEDGERLLTVHDAQTLAVIRTLDPSTPGDGFAEGIRCSDPDGREVQMLFSDEPSGSALLTVTQRGTKRVEVPVGSWRPAIDLDGFLSVVPTRDSSELPSLAHVGADGAVSRLSPFADARSIQEVAVSPDRMTGAAIISPPEDPSAPSPSEIIAAGGVPPEPAPSMVVTFHPRTGTELARFKPRQNPRSLAWASDGRLLVRVGFENTWTGFRPGTVEVRDRSLRLLSSLPAGPGQFFAVVGTEAVTFARSRLTFAGPAGARVVDNLWLAGTYQVVALGDPQPLTSPVSTDDQLPLVLGGLLLVVLGLGLAGRRAGCPLVRDP